jgi:uncharacterized protein YgiM (DUF1202 family)
MKKNYWLILAAALTAGLLAPQLPAADATAPAADPASPAPAGPAKKKPAAKKAAADAKKLAAPSPARETAAPLPPGPAVVKQNNVNVRGQATITSEVVGHLMKGDHVTVLEEVVLAHPKVDEPAQWAKIALPANVAVWVHGGFINPTSKTVVPNRLNLRGGPGENYSVLGRLDKGATVHPLETKGEWIKIEPPASAYAFVASHLLAPEAAAPPVIAAVEKPAAPAPAPAPVPAPTTPPAEAAVATPPPPAPAQEPTNAPPVATTAPAPTPAPAPAAPAVTIPAPAPETPTPTPTPPPAETTAVAKTPLPAVPPVPEPLLVEESKRVVTREGLVRRSVSIQAPTYFVLESLDTGRAINYLYSTNLALRDFKGRHIIVTGEELLDERWPNTPVITIEKTNNIDVMP